jgi:hypothetical protein
VSQEPTGHRNARRGSGRGVGSAIIGAVILIEVLGGVKHRWRQAEGEAAPRGALRLSDDGGGGGGDRYFGMGPDRASSTPRSTMRRCHLLHAHRADATRDDEDVHARPDQLGGQFGNALHLIPVGAALRDNVLAVDPTQLPQPFIEWPFAPRQRAAPQGAPHPYLQGMCVDSSLYHLIRPLQQRRRDGQAERLWRASFRILSTTCTAASGWVRATEYRLYRLLETSHAT